jgi:hypothetical protein
VSAQITNPGASQGDLSSSVKAPEPLSQLFLCHESGRFYFSLLPQSHLRRKKCMKEGDSWFQGMPSWWLGVRSGFLDCVTLKVTSPLWFSAIYTQRMTLIPQKRIPSFIVNWSFTLLRLNTCSPESKGTYLSRVFTQIKLKKFLWRQTQKHV